MQLNLSLTLPQPGEALKSLASVDAAALPPWAVPILLALIEFVKKWLSGQTGKGDKDVSDTP